MKQLSKLQSIMFLIGGLLMVISTGCFVFMWHQKVVCWVFLTGTVLFTLMQLMQTYEGNSFTVKRLKKIQAVADLFFVLSGIVMVDSAYQFLLPLFQNGQGTGYFTYIEYIYNKWVLLLLVAAILEIYTTHRIASELNKSKNT
ncbi:MAG: hypothetical protein LKG25_01270 [Prevotella sp.]|nr:hypothetical protein [Prevotella sp.]MCI1281208.1 hypothetical protein [Prevotella sp.]